MTLDFVTNLLITSAFIAAAVLVGRYAAVKWSKSSAGRATMSLFFTVLTVFGLIMVGAWTGNDYPGRSAIRITAYSGANILLWYTVYLLIVDQRRGRGK